jgi:hypothetical protein
LHSRIAEAAGKGGNQTKGSSYNTKAKLSKVAETKIAKKTFLHNTGFVRERGSFDTSSTKVAFSHCL